MSADRRHADDPKLNAADNAQSGDRKISPDRRHASKRYWQQIGDSQETEEYEQIGSMPTEDTGSRQETVRRQENITR